jgi:hypothetical protein
MEDFVWRTFVACKHFCLLGVFDLEFVLCLSASRALRGCEAVAVDPFNHRGTPLHLAAAKEQDQDMKILPEHGADVSW